MSSLSSLDPEVLILVDCRKKGPHLRIIVQKDLIDVLNAESACRRSSPKSSLDPVVFAL